LHEGSPFATPGLGENAPVDYAAVQQSMGMKYAQRVGKYMRLRQELAVVSCARPRDNNYIVRLRNEIAALEQSMALPLQAPSADAFLPTQPGR
jgi:hypothetical protein